MELISFINKDAQLPSLKLNKLINSRTEALVKVNHKKYQGKTCDLTGFEPSQAEFYVRL